MTFLILLLIGTTALISSLLGDRGWRKTESYLDAACIGFAMCWIATTGRGQPCAGDLDPQHPWDRPATRHAIDWKAR